MSDGSGVDAGGAGGPRRSMRLSWYLVLASYAFGLGTFVQRANDTCGITLGVDLVLALAALVLLSFVVILVQRARLGSGSGRRLRLVALYALEVGLVPLLLVDAISVVFADSC